MRGYWRRCVRRTQVSENEERWEKSRQVDSCRNPYHLSNLRKILWVNALDDFFIIAKICSIGSKEFCAWPKTALNLLPVIRTLDAAHLTQRRQVETRSAAVVAEHDKSPKPTPTWFIRVRRPIVADDQSWYRWRKCYSSGQPRCPDVRGATSRTLLCQRAIMRGFPYYSDNVSQASFSRWIDSSEHHPNLSHPS